MNQSPQTPNEEKNILNRSAMYSISLYVRMFFKLVGGMIIAKVLGPSLYGLRNAFDLALEYESYSNLGTFAALNRQAPYYRGENDTKTANLAISSVFSINMMFSALVAIVLILISFYGREVGWEIKYIDFFFFLGLIIFTQKLKEFYTTKLKIDKNFYLLSKMEMLYGISITLIGIPLVYFIGFRGLLLSIFLLDVVSIGYILIKDWYLPPINISFRLLWTLVKIGFPIMILFSLLLLLRNADRTLILAMISEEALGYYGIATIATSIVGTIPTAIHSVTIAPMMEKLGNTKDIYRIKNYLTEPTILLAYVIPLLLAAIFFGIHLPIKYYLTEYEPSINVVKLLILGLFFEAVARPSLSMALALDKQTKLVFVAGPMVALNFALSYLFIRFGWGVSGVALGTSITYFIFFCVISWYALRQFKVMTAEYLSVLFSVFIPFLYSSLLMFTLDKLFTANIQDLWSDLLFTLIRASLFILLYGLIILRIRKHSAFVKLIDNLPLTHLIPNKLRVRLSGKI